MRRVVITGIGAVSPNGIGRERFWEATRNGVSGVRRITRFDPSGIPGTGSGRGSRRVRREEVRGDQGPAARFARRPAGRGQRRRGRGRCRARRHRHDARRTARHRRDRRLRRRQPGFHRRAVPALLRRPDQAVQRVHHSHRHHRHAGQRSLHALRLSRAEPHRLHRLHVLHRRHGLRLPQHSGGRAGHHGDGRRGFADRAADPARLPVDAHHVHALEPRAARAPRGPSPRIATAS